MDTIKNLPLPLKLDLACGQSKQEGFFGIDIVDVPGVDLVWDLEKYPWPFEDNSVDEVHMQHFIEHVKDLILLMNELHRIMKPLAKATIITPYYTSIRATQDPTHVRFMSEGSSLYWSKAWRDREGLSHYNFTCDFYVMYIHAINEGWSNIWPYMDQVSKDYAVRHYWNVVDDIVYQIYKVDSGNPDKLPPGFTNEVMQFKS